MSELSDAVEEQMTPSELRVTLANVRIDRDSWKEQALKKVERGGFWWRVLAGCVIGAVAIVGGWYLNGNVSDVGDVLDVNQARSSRADCIRDKTNDMLQLTLEFERGTLSRPLTGVPLTTEQIQDFDRRAAETQKALELIDKGVLCPPV